MLFSTVNYRYASFNNQSPSRTWYSFITKPTSSRLSILVCRVSGACFNINTLPATNLLNTVSFHTTRAPIMLSASAVPLFSIHSLMLEFFLRVLSLSVRTTDNIRFGDSNVEAVLNKRQPGDSPRTTKQNKTPTPPPAQSACCPVGTYMSLDLISADLAVPLQ